MLRALVKIVAFALIILASCVLVNWVLIPSNPDAYPAAKLDKLDMLARTPSPKIVLVGGSNLAFSLDSQLLADEFGFHVVNMGLAKSVGLEYMLEEVKPYIQQGDLVILAPEYELFYDMYYGSDGLMVELQYHPGGLKNLRSWGQWRTLLSKFAPIMQAKFAGYLRKGEAGLIDSVYHRTGFNHFGDLETHLGRTPHYETHELFPDGDDFHEESIKVLNDFNDFVLSRGARALFTWPSLAEPEFEKHKDRIWSLDQRLRLDLAMPIISKPEDYIFKMRDMFDTCYHLGREGRRVRTHRLIDDLELTQGIGIGGGAEPA